MSMGARIKYFDGTEIAVVIGLGEQIKAPRDIANLEKAGWVFDDGLRMTYQAFLAAKRQGDIEAGTQFETWADGISDVDLQPSKKQLDQAVALGKMTRDEADRLLEVTGAPSGEA